MEQGLSREEKGIIAVPGVCGRDLREEKAAEVWDDGAQGVVVDLKVLLIALVGVSVVACDCGVDDRRGDLEEVDGAREADDDREEQVFGHVDGGWGRGGRECELGVDEGHAVGREAGILLCEVCPVCLSVEKHGRGIDLAITNHEADATIEGVDNLLGYRHVGLRDDGRGDGVDVRVADRGGRGGSGGRGRGRRWRRRRGPRGAFVEQLELVQGGVERGQDGAEGVDGEEGRGWDAGRVRGRDVGCVGVRGRERERGRVVCKVGVQWDGQRGGGEDFQRGRGGQ